MEVQVANPWRNRLDRRGGSADRGDIRADDRRLRTDGRGRCPRAVRSGEPARGASDRSTAPVRADQLPLLPHISNRYVGNDANGATVDMRPASRASCTAGDKDVTKGSKCHSSPPTGTSGGRFSRSPSPVLWFSPAVPAPPTTAAATAPRTRPTTGFSIMVAQANDADDYYAKMAAKYTEETGVEIEMIPYPSDAYNTQVTTQLQAGNAADMMVLAPGTGQAISVVTLAEADFLEPLDDTSAAVIPEGSENLVRGRRRDLRPAHRARTRRPDLQRRRRRRGRPRRLPRDVRRPARGVHHRARRRQDLHRPRRRRSRSTRACSRCSSRRRASTRPTPTGTSSAPQATSPSSAAAGEDVLDDIIEMNDGGCFQDGVEGGTFDTITQNVASAARR